MRGRVWHWVGSLLVLAALWVIFSLYRQPVFLVDMADRLWACF